MREVVLKLFREGKSLKEIKSLTGLSPQEVVREVLAIQETQRRRFTKEQMALFLIEEGVPPQEVKEVLKASSAIFTRLRQKGVPVERQTKEKVFLKLLEEGKTLEEIKRELGFSDNAFSQFLRRMKEKGLIKVRRVKRPQYVVEHGGKIFVSNLPPLKVAS